MSPTKNFSAIILFLRIHFAGVRSEFYSAMQWSAVQCCAAVCATSRFGLLRFVWNVAWLIYLGFRSNFTRYTEFYTIVQPKTESRGPIGRIGCSGLRPLRCPAKSVSTGSPWAAAGRLVLSTGLSLHICSYHSIRQ